jgi:hypothetical protein
MRAMNVFNHNYTVLKSRLPSGRWAFLLSLFLILAASSAVWAAVCTPAPAGLVGWWPGEGNANDIVGTNNGTLMGGATANQAGYVGLAFKFDGTNGYAQIPDSPVFHPTNFTIEAWVHFDSLDSPSVGGSPPGQAYIIFKHNSRSNGEQIGFSAGKDRNLISTPGDTFSFEVSSASGVLVYLESTTLISTGVWYHIAGVRGPDFIQLFVNGQLESQTNVAFPQDYDSQPLLFGTTGISSWDHKFDGMLDEVTLYNRVLSSNEVAALYASGRAGKCKPPVLLTQPSGQTDYWGSSVTFTAAVTGVNPLAYRWQKAGATISGATNPALVLTNLQITNAGNYDLLVTNVDGSVTSNPVLLVMKVADMSIALAHVQKVAALTLRGVSNKTYGIQFSSNLANWVGLTNLTLTAPTNVWLDPHAATQAARFYRVGQGPIPIP